MEPVICGNEYLIKAGVWLPCPPDIRYRVCDPESGIELLQCSAARTAEDNELLASGRVEEIPSLRVLNTDGDLVVSIVCVNKQLVSNEASLGDVASVLWDVFVHGKSFCVWDSSDRFLGTVCRSPRRRRARYYIFDADGNEIICVKRMMFGVDMLFLSGKEAVARLSRKLRRPGLFLKERVTARHMVISERISWDDPARLLILAAVLMFCGDSVRFGERYLRG